MSKMRKRGEIESLFYQPDDEVDKMQWRKNLELEVMLDIRDLLHEILLHDKAGEK